MFLRTAANNGPYNNVPRLAVTHDMQWGNGVPRSGTLEIISGPADATVAAQTEVATAVRALLNVIADTPGTAWNAVNGVGNKADHTVCNNAAPVKVLTPAQIRQAYNAHNDVDDGLNLVAAGGDAAMGRLLVCANHGGGHPQANFGLKMDRLGRVPDDDWVPARDPANLGNLGARVHARIRANLAALMAELDVAARNDEEAKGFFTYFLMHFTLEWARNEFNMDGAPGRAVNIKNVWGLLPKAGLEHALRAVSSAPVRAHLRSFFHDHDNAWFLNYFCSTVNRAVFPAGFLSRHFGAGHRRKQLCRNTLNDGNNPKTIYAARAGDFAGENAGTLGFFYTPDNNYAAKSSDPRTTNAPKPLPLFKIGAADNSATAMVVETRPGNCVLAKTWSFTFNNARNPKFDFSADDLRAGVNKVRTLNGLAPEVVA